MNAKTITIAGSPFEVSAPYVEGATITAAEAKVLNQTRAENIGNNFRKQVKEALDKNDLTAVTAAIAEYDREYAFTLSNATRTPADPLAAEALKIAREYVKGKLAAKGVKSLKEYLAIEGNEAKYDAALEKAAGSEEIIKIAKKRLAEKKKVLDVTTDELDL